jgi:putative colanic acid biosynthesis glycosyltransferase
VVINDGVDLSVFKPGEGSYVQRHGLEDKSVVLGVASHWSAARGYTHFGAVSNKLRDDELIVLAGLRSWLKSTQLRTYLYALLF